MHSHNNLAKSDRHIQHSLEVDNLALVANEEFRTERNIFSPFKSNTFRILISTHPPTKWNEMHIQMIKSSHLNDSRAQT